MGTLAFLRLLGGNLFKAIATGICIFSGLVSRACNQDPALKRTQLWGFNVLWSPP